VLSIGQNLQLFTGNGDGSIRVKYFERDEKRSNNQSIHPSFFGPLERGGAK
jgi:hypothetical protein